MLSDQRVRFCILLALFLTLSFFYTIDVILADKAFEVKRSPIVIALDALKHPKFEIPQWTTAIEPDGVVLQNKIWYETIHPTKTDLPWWWITTAVIDPGRSGPTPEPSSGPTPGSPPEPSPGPTPGPPPVTTSDLLPPTPSNPTTPSNDLSPHDPMPPSKKTRSKAGGMPTSGFRNILVTIITLGSVLGVGFGIYLRYARRGMSIRAELKKLYSRMLKKSTPSRRLHPERQRGYGSVHSARMAREKNIELNNRSRFDAYGYGFERA